MTDLPRHFNLHDRLHQPPVLNTEYHLTTTYAPTSPLLDELQHPLWWTPTGITHPPVNDTHT